MVATRHPSGAADPLDCSPLMRGPGGTLPVTEDAFRRAVRAAEGQARTYCGQLPNGKDTDAFFGEARLACWASALSFNPERGWSYLSWAYKNVGFALKEEARRQDPLKRATRDRLNAVLEKVQAGEALTDEEAEFLARIEVPAGMLDADLRRGETGRAGEDGETTVFLLDALEDRECDVEAYALERLQVAEVLATFDGLRPEEREIVMLRFWLGVSQKAVAARLGLAARTVRERERTAILKIRGRLGWE